MAKFLTPGVYQGNQGTHETHVNKASSIKTRNRIKKAEKNPAKRKITHKHETKTTRKP